MSNRIWGALAAIALLVTLLGSYSLVVAQVATKGELGVVAERLDNKIASDRLAALQERLWSLQDRFSEQFFNKHIRYPASMEELYAWVPPEAREQLRLLEVAIKELEAMLAGKGE